MRTYALATACALALAAPHASAAAILFDDFESRGLAAGAAVEGALSFPGIPVWRTGGQWNSGLRNPTGTGRFSTSNPLASPAGGTAYAYASVTGAKPRAVVRFGDSPGGSFLIPWRGADTRGS